MAQATGTLDSFGVIGNREDLSDLIGDVSPTETPVLSAMGSTTAKSTLHEWQTKVFAAAKMNQHIEGDDNADGSTLTVTTRPNNITPILSEKMIVSGTQQNGMTHAGVQSEMAMQKADKMAEIKLDCEFMMINGDEAGGIGNVKTAGDSSTPREMSSLQTYIADNVSLGATGTAPNGDGTDAIGAGTPRALTEDLVTAVLQSCYVNGANPSMLAVDAVNKGLVSNFDGGSTRYVDTDTKSLTHSIDVYVGDFHTLKVTPCRQMPAEIVYAIDPKYLKKADLRPLSSYKLGLTGDNLKEQMDWETTLEVCTGRAHGMITDLGG